MKSTVFLFYVTEFLFCFKFNPWICPPPLRVVKYEVNNVCGFLSSEDTCKCSEQISSLFILIAIKMISVMLY